MRRKIKIAIPMLFVTTKTAAAFWAGVWSALEFIAHYLDKL